MHEAKLMTLVLDTQPWSIEYAQYDPLFRFYEQGLRDVIYRAYLSQAKSRNASQYLSGHEQLAFATSIELDYHDMLACELETHNEQARDYLAHYAIKETLLIDQISAEILARVHLSWRHFFPEQRAVFHPMSLRWHNESFSITAAVEPIQESPEFGY
jgi:hypothetical protein